MAYKQHFIEWFSGKQLPSYWTTDGAGTFGMSDSVDGGYQFTESGGGANTAIYFNNKRQYAHNGSVFIYVVKPIVTAGYYVFAGCGTDANIGSFLNKAFYDNAAVLTYKRLRTSDGSTVQNTDTDVATNSNWTNVKIETKSASVELTIDGVLKATNSTNIPTVKLQPVIAHGASAVSGRGVQVRYCEAYNT